jgi:hypothetical protein
MSLLKLWVARVAWTAAVRCMIVIQVVASDADARIRAVGTLRLSAGYAEGEGAYEDKSGEQSCSRWTHGNTPHYCEIIARSAAFSNRV